MSKLDITIGVEEEAFLVDPESRNLVVDPDPGIFEHCEANASPHKVVRELLRTQIESNSRVCNSMTELKQALQETRGVISEAAKKHGAEIAAIGTHPFAAWQDQQPTLKERYKSATLVYQEAVRRFLIGGMHIHAGFGDEESRIKVMNVIRHYLPVFLALSTSSPFREGLETGFKSSRMNIMSSLPRTGIPNEFESHEQYDNLVKEYQRWKFVQDASEFWWDIRPSIHYPTIEMRVCDVCPKFEDALTIAALYVCLIRRYLRSEDRRSYEPEALTEIISENKWQAQRYGIFAFLADPFDGHRVDIEDIVIRLIEELAEDADALGCTAELNHAKDIVRTGAGADRQLDLYRLAILEGASHEKALDNVVDMVIRETAEGI